MQHGPVQGPPSSAHVATPVLHVGAWQGVREGVVGLVRVRPAGLLAAVRAQHHATVVRAGVPEQLQQELPTHLYDVCRDKVQLRLAHAPAQDGVHGTAEAVDPGPRQGRGRLLRGRPELVRLGRGQQRRHGPGEAHEPPDGVQPAPRVERLLQRPFDLPLRRHQGLYAAAAGEERGHGSLALLAATLLLGALREAGAVVLIAVRRSLGGLRLGGYNPPVRHGQQALDLPGGEEGARLE
mmetsp:Transcript_86276/g.279336  ORF Transcript_86276/g.279336 Transcript_86276/m.279336 type:complete len:238 (-) Transcript_86276:633-1346(-)